MGTNMDGTKATRIDADSAQRIPAVIDTYWRDRTREADEQIQAACRALGALDAVLNMYDGVGGYVLPSCVGDGAWLANMVREQVSALESALISAEAGRS